MVDGETHITKNARRHLILSAKRHARIEINSLRKLLEHRKSDLKPEYRRYTYKPRRTEGDDWYWDPFPEASVEDLENTIIQLEDTIDSIYEMVHRVADTRSELLDNGYSILHASSAKALARRDLIEVLSIAHAETDFEWIKLPYTWYDCMLGSVRRYWAPTWYCKMSQKITGKERQKLYKKLAKVKKLSDEEVEGELGLLALEHV